MTDLTNWFVIGCAVVLAVFLLAFCSRSEPEAPFFPPTGQSTKQAESFIPRGGKPWGTLGITRGTTRPQLDDSMALETTR